MADRTPPVVVGLAGPSACGKTTFARRLARALGPLPSALVCLDDYYHSLAHLPLAERARANFDHPASIDVDLLIEHLHRLRQCEPIDCPVYDFTRHCRAGEVRPLPPAPVVIVEGILALAIGPLGDELDLGVYIDTPLDVCLARRVLRDVSERGRTPRQVVSQYLETVRPMYLEWVAPCKARADVVVDYADLDGGVRAVKARLDELPSARRW